MSNGLASASGPPSPRHTKQKMVSEPSRRREVSVVRIRSVDITGQGMGMGDGQGPSSLGGKTSIVTTPTLTVTLNPHPSTLSPHSSAPNPQPSTHTPQLSIINPQPPTPNPQSHAMNQESGGPAKRGRGAGHHSQGHLPHEGMQVMPQMPRDCWRVSRGIINFTRRRT